MKTEIKLNSQLVIIETPNTSASPGLVGCQCESGLAPESDTSTAVEHQCELQCMPGVLASLVLHWQAAHLHKHNAALTWQKSWPCNPHPSLPACIHACHKIKSSNWMSIGPHVVETNQHRRKQWFAFCQFEAEEEDSYCSNRGEPMTQETTKKISFG